MLFHSLHTRLQLTSYSIYVSAPVPFGFRSFGTWLGLVLRGFGFGTKGFGTGLDNFVYYTWSELIVSLKVLLSIIICQELRHCAPNCTIAQPRPRRPPIGCHVPPVCRQPPLIGSGSGSERLWLSSGVSSRAPCRSRAVFFSAQSAFGR